MASDYFCCCCCKKKKKSKEPVGPVGPVVPERPYTAEPMVLKNLCTVRRDDSDVFRTVIPSTSDFVPIPKKKKEFESPEVAAISQLVQPKEYSGTRGSRSKKYRKVNDVKKKDGCKFEVESRKSVSFSKPRKFSNSPEETVPNSSNVIYFTTHSLSDVNISIDKTEIPQPTSADMDAEYPTDDSLSRENMKRIVYVDLGKKYY